MGDTRVLTNLRFLELYKCSNCVESPALGLLPSLEELLITNLSNLKRIGVEIYGGGQSVTEVAFPKLITLKIVKAEKLEVLDLDNNGEVQAGKIMPHVTNIKLSRCRSLIALPALDKLPSLETLEIENADQLKSISLNGFTSFPKLAELQISDMRNLEEIVFGALREGETGDTNSQNAIMPCLRSLLIDDCAEFKSFGYPIKSLPSIEEEDEEKEEDLSLLPSILHVDLSCCPKLFSFPRHLPIIHLEDMARFKELQVFYLHAYLGESFKFIPEYLQNLNKLEFVWIKDKRGMYQGGDWSILSHISDVFIGGNKIDPLT
ncbi:hypothetical protein MKW94_011790 [Papaver nudicaule]|uniref:Uncharacterized protein n=1 Tax=Papaver nudicaule TaxID=74823 RepID=A0AA42AZG5_PAPNU|nr:hypothetical protein [Papaver nudicaule]